MRVWVTRHAIDRFRLRFPWRVRNASNRELAKRIARLFQRSKLDRRWDLVERRRKGRMFFIAQLYPDEKGRFTHRCVLTLYRGQRMPRTEGEEHLERGFRPSLVSGYLRSGRRVVSNELAGLR